MFPTKLPMIVVAALQMATLRAACFSTEGNAFDVYTGITNHNQSDNELQYTLHYQKRSRETDSNLINITSKLKKNAEIHLRKIGFFYEQKKYVSRGFHLNVSAPYKSLRDTYPIRKLLPTPANIHPLSVFKIAPRITRSLGHNLPLHYGRDVFSYGTQSQQEHTSFTPNTDSMGDSPYYEDFKRQPVHPPTGNSFGLFQRQESFHNTDSADNGYFSQDQSRNTETYSRDGSESSHHQLGDWKEDLRSSQPPLQGVSSNGLQWLSEPPRLVRFSNSTGGRVDCAVSGVTSDIVWMFEDGRPVIEIPGLLQPLPNGTLLFPPFPPHRYEAALHSASFVCRVRSPLGALLSLPLKVRAVVLVNYEVQTYNTHVLPGNTAVMTCMVPSYVSDYVEVTSWIKDDTFNIFPSQRGDGKHHVSPVGVLRVLHVTPTDSASQYRCRTRDTLSGIVRVSTPARIVLSDASGPEPPRALGHQSQSVVAAVGSLTTLPCNSQGNPPPSHSWFNGSSSLDVPSADGRLLLVGGTLVVTSVLLTDAGDYRCVVNNSAGSTTFSTHLTVVSPFAVQISPSSAEVNTGGRLELRCLATGSPMNNIAWYKDGELIRKENPSGRGGYLGGDTNGGFTDVLRLPSAQASDVGVYQCRASGAHDAAQAFAVVTLGASPPRLVYRFIAHTLQPGPAVTLKCIARASPTPNIAWTLDGFPLPQSHRFLIGQFVSSHGDVISHVNISNVRVSDGGLYQCEARNSAGSEAHSARLNVYGPPTIRQIGPLTAVAGQSFTVACPVGGHPIDKIVWKKDGTELPLSQHQLVEASGRLTLLDVTRDADEGTYACSARDRQGRGAEQAFVLSVAVPPRLAPVFFSKGTRAGMRAQVTCLVQEGDTPITLLWLKDGAPLSNGGAATLDLDISQLNEFTSVLVIERAQARHSGNYTCAATNAAQTSYSSSVLSVTVPPSWVLEPSDVSVPLGGAVEVPCSASGHPQPTVTWRKHSESGNWRTIVFDPNLALIGHSSGSSLRRSDAGIPDSGSPSNTHDGGPQEGLRTSSIQVKSATSSEGEGGDSALMVVRAGRQHEGRYLCQAKNGVGGGLSKLIKLTVKEPPWFPDAPRGIEAEVGSTVTLSCLAKGDLPLTLAWHRQGQPVARTLRFHTETVKEAEGGRSLQLTVQDARPTDSGDFTCFASNEHGTHSVVYHLLVQDVPEAPSGLELVEIGSRFLSLRWTAANLGTMTTTAPVSAFQVSYATEDGSVQLVRTVTAQVRLQQLVPATEYSVQVAAVNKVGRSSPSPPLTVTTRQEKPSGSPTDVQVVSATSRSVRLRWSSPLRNATHGTLLGYHIGYTDNSFIHQGHSRPYNFTSITLPSAVDTPISPTDEHNAPAHHSHEGSSAAVMQYRVYSDSDEPQFQSLPNADGSSQVNAVVESVFPDGRVEVTLDGLRANTRYAMLVKAFNSMGSGPSSPAVTATTSEDKPSEPPQEVKCVGVTSSTLKVTWSPPPASTANGIITGYRVAYAKVPDYGNQLDLDGYVIDPSDNKNLGDVDRKFPSSFFGSKQFVSYTNDPYHSNRNDVNYAARVSASDSASDQFLLGNAVSSSFPHARANVNGVSLAAGFGVGMTPAVADGGVLVVAEGQAARLVSLAAYTNYTVVVAAATGAGVGVASAAIVCATLEDVPLPPDAVKAIPSGPSSAIVTWRVPSHPRGRVTHYTVRWSTLTPGTEDGQDGLSPLALTVHQPTDHAELNNLPQGITKVWVTASTEAGEGQPGSTVTVAPSETVGAGVWSVGSSVSLPWRGSTALECRAVGRGTIIKTWTREGKKLQEDSHVSIGSDGALNIHDALQRHSGRYVCTAANQFSADNVTYSLLVLVPPSTPTLHVTESTDTSVRLQWQADTQQQVPLLGATLHYRRAGEPHNERVLDRSHVVRGLHCGTAYSFSLTAHNAIGSSSPSPTVEARTKGRPPSAPPQFQFITTNSTHATLYLSQWQSGGCDITHYNVQCKPKDQQHWTTVSSRVSPERTFTVGSLEPGRQYDLRVTAFNAAGETPALYSVPSPTGRRDVAGSVGSQYDNYGSSTSWPDVRIAVPAAVSVAALLMVLSTVCACFYNRHRQGKEKSSEPQGVVSPIEDAGSKSHLAEPVDTLRRPPLRCSTQDYDDHDYLQTASGVSDYNESEIYHYTSPTLQMKDLVLSSPSHGCSKMNNLQSDQYNFPKNTEIDHFRGRQSLPPSNNGFNPIHDLDYSEVLPPNPKNHPSTGNHSVLPTSLHNRPPPYSESQQPSMNQHYCRTSTSVEQDDYASLVYAAPSTRNGDGSNVLTDDSYGELRGSSASEVECEDKLVPLQTQVPRGSQLRAIDNCDYNQSKKYDALAQHDHGSHEHTSHNGDDIHFDNKLEIRNFKNKSVLGKKSHQRRTSLHQQPTVEVHQQSTGEIKELQEYEMHRLQRTLNRPRKNQVH